VYVCVRVYVRACVRVWLVSMQLWFVYVLCKASATGEVTLEPDICIFSVLVSSQKDRLQDAKDSVARRLDYILQALHNRHLKVFCFQFINVVLIFFASFILFLIVF